MCTVTALQTGESLTLFFNRDERHSRPAAHPPRLHSNGPGIPYLAPIDPEGGGTWLAVNRNKVVVGLLNYYPGQTKSIHPAYRKSRGRLVTALAALPDPSEMDQFLDHGELRKYPPFYCFSLNLPAGGYQWEWDGNVLNTVPIHALPWFCTTSSRQQEKVIAHRNHLFRHSLLSEDAVEALHFSRGSKTDAYSFRMMRDDARTVSISKIQVTKKKMVYHYSPIVENGHIGAESEIILHT